MPIRLAIQPAALLAPSNTWASKRSMLAARFATHAGTINNVINGATAIGGTLYVAGGSTANGSSTKTLHVYDPATNT
jgi:Kelch motif